MRKIAAIAAAFTVAAGFGRTAAALPPEIPERPLIVAECTAAKPLVGQSFNGIVLQVVGADTVCVAEGPTPAEWIQIKIARAPADSNRGALMAASFGQRVECLAVASGPSGLIARCAVGGAPLETLLADPAIRLEGRQWR